MLFKTGLLKTTTTTVVSFFLRGFASKPPFDAAAYGKEYLLRLRQNGYPATRDQRKEFNKKFYDDNKLEGRDRTTMIEQVSLINRQIQVGLFTMKRGILTVVKWHSALWCIPSSSGSMPTVVESFCFFEDDVIHSFQENTPIKWMRWSPEAMSTFYAVVCSCKKNLILEAKPVKKTKGKRARSSFPRGASRLCKSRRSVSMAPSQKKEAVPEKKTPALAGLGPEKTGSQLAPKVASSNEQKSLKYVIMVLKKKNKQEKKKISKLAAILKQKNQTTEPLKSEMDKQKEKASKLEKMLADEREKAENNKKNTKRMEEQIYRQNLEIEKLEDKLEKRVTIVSTYLGSFTRKNTMINKLKSQLKEKQ